MIKLIIIFCAASCLIACQSAPPVQYYVLEPINVTMPPDYEAVNSKAVIGIGPITIPGLLDRKKMVTRGLDNTVHIAEFQEWAVPIQDNIAETLAHNLTSLQPSYIFRVYPWSVYGMVDFQVVIDILRFDATPGKSVNLEAIWTIKNEKNQVLLKHGRTSLKQALLDTSYSGIAKGLSKVLGAFSQELNIAILRIADKTDKIELN